MGRRTCYPQIPEFPEKEILLLKKVVSALSLQNVISLNTRASAPKGEMTVNYPIFKLDKRNRKDTCFSSINILMKIISVLAIQTRNHANTIFISESCLPVSSHGFRVKQF